MPDSMIVENRDRGDDLNIDEKVYTTFLSLRMKQASCTPPPSISPVFPAAAGAAAFLRRIGARAQVFPPRQMIFDNRTEPWRKFSYAGHFQ
jgi:hypothetical protein